MENPVLDAIRDQFFDKKAPYVFNGSDGETMKGLGLLALAYEVNGLRAILEKGYMRTELKEMVSVFKEEIVQAMRKEEE